MTTDRVLPQQRLMPSVTRGFDVTAFTVPATTVTLAAANTNYDVATISFTTIAGESVQVVFSANWFHANPGFNKVLDANLFVLVDGAQTYVTIEKIPLEPNIYTRHIASFTRVVPALSEGAHTIIVRVSTTVNHTDTTGNIERIAAWLVRR